MAAIAETPVNNILSLIDNLVGEINRLNKRDAKKLSKELEKIYSYYFVAGKDLDTNSPMYHWSLSHTDLSEVVRKVLLQDMCGVIARTDDAMRADTKK